MAVAADDGGAREGESLLWPNNMDNSLSLVAEAKVCDTEILNVPLQRDTLCPGVIFLDEARNVFQRLASGGRDVLRLWSDFFFLFWGHHGG